MRWSRKRPKQIKIYLKPNKNSKNLNRPSAKISKNPRIPNYPYKSKMMSSKPSLTVKSQNLPNKKSLSVLNKRTVSMRWKI
jgi:hypothetical protein